MQCPSTATLNSEVTCTAAITGTTNQASWDIVSPDKSQKTIGFPTNTNKFTVSQAGKYRILAGVTPENDGKTVMGEADIQVS